MKKILGCALLVCLAVSSLTAAEGYEGRHFYLTPQFGFKHDTTSAKDLFAGLNFEFAMSRRLGIGFSMIGMGWDDWFHQSRHGHDDWDGFDVFSRSRDSEGYGLISFDGIVHFLSLAERRIDLFAGVGAGVSVSVKHTACVSDSRDDDDHADGNRHHHDLAFENVRVGPFIGAKFFFSRRFGADVRIYESLGRLKGVCYSFGLSFKI